MNALEIKGLTKTYDTGVVALKDVNLTIKEGDFFGLLGPNGAGKTTIIGTVCGLVKKTKGEVQVFSHSIDTEFEAARTMIGLVPQEMNFNIFETVHNIVVDQAGYYGIARSVAKERAQHYLKELGLWEKRDMASRTLSGGMKRRLMIARALVHEPRLLILDEPTAGVDVELRRGMWDFLTALNKKGTTIILTTHYLEEAEMLCRNLAIINKGIIIEHGPTKELLTKLHNQTFRIDLVNTIPASLQKVSFSWLKADEQTIEVQTSADCPLQKVLDELRKHNILILSIKPKTNRLEELFMQMTEAQK